MHGQCIACQIQVIDQSDGRQMWDFEGISIVVVMTRAARVQKMERNASFTRKEFETSRAVRHAKRQGKWHMLALILTDLF